MVRVPGRGAAPVAFGLVAVLAIGGWLVIEGKSDVGIVVAATIGLGRIQQPWRQLVTFYRNLNAISVQYGLMQEMFEELPPEEQKQAAAQST